MMAIASNTALTKIIKLNNITIWCLKKNDSAGKETNKTSIYLPKSF